MKKARVWIFAVAFAFLVVWIIGGSHSFQQCIEQKQSQTTEQHLQKSISDLLFARGIYRDCLGEFVEESAEPTIAGFTIVLAFATIFLWGSTRDLVDGAEDAARRQLRAYVFITQSKVIGAGTAEPKVELVVQNMGRTPAYDVTVATLANTANVPPGRSVFETAEVTAESSRFVLGPGGVGHKNMPIKTLAPPEAMPGLKAGDGALYVWGTVFYTDTFGDRQQSHYRSMIGGADGWPDDDKLRVCQEGNKAT